MDGSRDRDEVKRAVEEYKKFLRLKIMDGDLDSRLYAPSPTVDAVWHAHKNNQN
jgi:hypothetical protein